MISRCCARHARLPAQSSRPEAAHNGETVESVR
jgi:hypothetical protein